MFKICGTHLEAFAVTMIAAHIRSSLLVFNASHCSLRQNETLTSNIVNSFKRFNHVLVQRAPFFFSSARSYRAVTNTQRALSVMPGLLSAGYGSYVNK